MSTWTAITVKVVVPALFLVCCVFSVWIDQLRHKVREIEKRLDNTFHQGPERKPVSLNRQRTTQGEKGVARQSHVQMRGQRINNPEK